MYAYRQQAQVRTLHAVPQRRTAPARPVKVQKRKIKKKNPIIELFRLTVVLSFLIAYSIFVFPTVFNTLIKQVVAPDNIKTTSETEIMSTDVNLYSLAYPVTNYINNDLFNNRLLLTPTIEKAHSEVTTMYHSSEMSGLKKELQNLMAQYPTIKPSIYVWEYEQGRYIDIDADKQYPAASIIKLPVLVRMFKSIEANQFTI